MNKKLASVLVVALAMSGATGAMAEEGDGFWSKFLGFFSTERADADVGASAGQDDPFDYVTRDDNDDDDAGQELGMDDDSSYGDDRGDDGDGYYD